ncbi:MAG TPA: alpha-amlyase [Flavobacteriales bacterium]|nr:alpha-amlyase [Flavobacteriales bacterium]
MKKILITLLISSILGACNQTKKSEIAQKSPNQTQKVQKPVASDSLYETAVIYEANIRQYSPKGDFNSFTKDIPKLKQLGVKIIWLMPIYPISEVKRKAIGDKFVSDIKNPEEQKKYLGSPYAVADYTKVNPDFGTYDDLDYLIQTAHENGMIVILDWVANHTGWDHPWIKNHPNFYTHNKKGEITDPLNADGTSKGWQDVADLNYDNPALHKAMINDMSFWIKNHDIDGFRCDVAGEVPVSFWKEAIHTLRQQKPVFMLAEAWEPELLKDDMFDACYAWEGHFLLADMAKGKKTVKDWDAYVQKIDTMYEPDDILMNFTANHDENSWKGTEDETFGKAKNLARVMTFMIKGMPLIYSGQEYGLKHRLKFFEKDLIDRTNGKDFELYTKLGHLKNTHPALNSGKKPADYTRIPVDNPDVLAFSRQKGNNKLIFVGNFSDKSQVINLPEKGSYTDYFNQKNYNLADDNINIPAWGYIVLIKK